MPSEPTTDELNRWAAENDYDRDTPEWAAIRSQTGRDYPNVRDCEHGRQRRKCEICSANEEIARLENENARLVAAYEALVAEHQSVIDAAVLRERRCAADPRP